MARHPQYHVSFDCEAMTDEKISQIIQHDAARLQAAPQGGRVHQMYLKEIIYVQVEQVLRASNDSDNVERR